MFAFHRIILTCFILFLKFSPSTRIQKINIFWIASGIEFAHSFLSKKIIIIIKKRLFVCLLSWFAFYFNCHILTLTNGIHYNTSKWTNCLYVSFNEMHTGACNVENVQCSFNGNIKVPILFLLNGANVAFLFSSFFFSSCSLETAISYRLCHYYRHHSHAIYHLKTHWTVCLSNYEHVYIFAWYTRCARLFLKWKAYIYIYFICIQHISRHVYVKIHCYSKAHWKCECHRWTASCYR